MIATALVWCGGGWRSTNGKTAHGLVRFTRRFRVAAVIDETVGDGAGDAGVDLDGVFRSIPLVTSLSKGMAAAASVDAPAPSVLVVGLAPDGGRLPESGRSILLEAIGLGLSVVSGLHDLLVDDDEIAAAAAAAGVTLTDVRAPRPRSTLSGWTGAIATARCRRIALLGTDSAVGKRTTAWMLVDALQAKGVPAALIGTGQTAWLQGARYGFVLDSTLNDFVAGELERAVLEADRDGAAVVVIEGQGSLMNPAYPGGHEILAATRPHAVVLQHAPERREYDGFPGFELDPLDVQIRAITLLGRCPVRAITVHQQGLVGDAIDEACARLARETGLPVVAPLRHGVDAVIDAVLGPT